MTTEFRAKQTLGDSLPLVSSLSGLLLNTPRDRSLISPLDVTLLGVTDLTPLFFLTIHFSSH